MFHDFSLVFFQNGEFVPCVHCCVLKSGSEDPLASEARHGSRHARRREGAPVAIVLGDSEQTHFWRLRLEESEGLPCHIVFF